MRPLFELITDLHHPDAAVVLLSVAILEHGLAEAIARECMGPSITGSCSGTAARSRRLLLWEETRYRMADAMGVILPTTAKDLHRVRHVRNAFAHAAAPIAFDTREVADEVTALTFFGHSDFFRVDDEGVPVTPKARFSAFVFLTCLSLTMTPAQWKELRDAFGEFANGLLNALRDFKGVTVPPPDAS